MIRRSHFYLIVIIAVIITTSVRGFSAPRTPGPSQNDVCTPEASTGLWIPKSVPGNCLDWSLANNTSILGLFQYWDIETFFTVDLPTIEEESNLANIMEFANFNGTTNKRKKNSSDKKEETAQEEPLFSVEEILENYRNVMAKLQDMQAGQSPEEQHSRRGASGGLNNVPLCPNRQVYQVNRVMPFCPHLGAANCGGFYPTPQEGIVTSAYTLQSLPSAFSNVNDIDLAIAVTIGGLLGAGFESQFCGPSFVLRLCAQFAVPKIDSSDPLTFALSGPQQYSAPLYTQRLCDYSCQALIDSCNGGLDFGVDYYHSPAAIQGLIRDAVCQVGCNSCHTREKCFTDSNQHQACLRTCNPFSSATANGCEQTSTSCVAFPPPPDTKKCDFNRFVQLVNAASSMPTGSSDLLQSDATWEACKVWANAD